MSRILLISLAFKIKTDFHYVTCFVNGLPEKQLLRLEFMRFVIGVSSVLGNHVSDVFAEIQTC